MLAFPAPVVLCYNRETAISEKVEAMITLGELNSRMKDFYDVWLLSRQFDFDGSTLRQSLLGTFKQRNTEVPASLKPLFDALVGIKQIQWTAFRRKLQQPQVPESFQDLSTSILGFIEPIIEAVFTGRPFRERWNAPGPWSPDQEEVN